MKMLLGACGDEDYNVHLTYPVQQIDAERKIYGTHANFPLCQ
jgi:hypothetical protein